MIEQQKYLMVSVEELEKLMNEKETLSEKAIILQRVDERSSRPAPAAPSCQTCVSEMAAFCSDCDRIYSKITTIRGYGATIVEQAKREERERVLPYLDELVSPSVSDSRKREILESLRSTTAKEHERGEQR